MYFHKLCKYFHKLTCPTPSVKPNGEPRSLDESNCGMERVEGVLRGCGEGRGGGCVERACGKGGGCVERVCGEGKGGGCVERVWRRKGWRKGARGEGVSIV
jgi:hypothetical protein